VNHNVAIREWPDAPNESERIVFLHKIVPGGSSKSYGLHVARMAGVPRDVVERSGEILEELQAGFDVKRRRDLKACGQTPSDDGQLSLFADRPDPMMEELKAKDLDRMSPIDAWRLLRELQERVRQR
jgi:DNA mismatch repair protein MutS